MDNVVIFIRQKQTYHFLKEDAKWSALSSEGRTFGSTWEALDFCLKKNVHRAEIVTRFGATDKYDVRIDVL